MGNSKVGIGNIIQAGNNWINNPNAQAPTGTGVDDFAASLIGIGQVLVAIGVVTLLIVSAIMAIKWITATPDKKADLKQQLIGLIVAAVVIFGALGIWRLAQRIGNTVENKIISYNSPKTQIIYLADK